MSWLKRKLKRKIAGRKVEVAGYPGLKLGFPEGRQALVRMAFVFALTAFLLAQLSLPFVLPQSETQLPQGPDKAASKDNPVEIVSLRTENSKTYDIGEGKRRLIVQDGIGLEENLKETEFKSRLLDLMGLDTPLAYAAQVTKQPPGADTYLYQLTPDDNYGSAADLLIQSYVSNMRSILKFDFSADIPAGSTIDLATLSLYKYWESNSSQGRTYLTYRLTQIGWTQTGATWNKYDGTNNWATAGGDYTTTNGASSTVPANNNWQNWAVTAQVQTALDSVSGVAHFIVRDETEGSGTGPRSYYRSKEFTTATLRPKLVIDYTPPASVPAAPTIGTPSALSTTSIRWNFTDNASDEDGFKVHNSAHTTMVSQATPNLSYLDETGLTANTQYTRHIHAYNGSGDSTASADASRYTLSATPNVTADKTTSVWYNTPDVVFTNAASFGAGGVQYYRYVWDQNSTYTFNDTETQWTTGTLTRTATASGSWYLHVKSFNGDNVANGTQDYGPYYYDGTQPTDPTGLSATAASTTQINLSFTGSTDSGGSSLAGYKIERAPDSGGSPGTFSQIDTTTSTSYNNTSLSPNTKYWYRVRAYDNASNNSGYTSNVSAVTLANIPTSPSATAASTSQIDLSWTSGGAQDHYHVYSSSNSYASPIYNSSPAATSQGSLSANTQYTYRIYGVNSADAESSTYTSVSKYTKIEQPTGVTWGTIGTSSIALSASGTLSNLSSGSSGLYFENTTQATNSGWIQTNSWTSSSLNPNTSYTFQVTSRNGDGVTNTSVSLGSKYTLPASPSASADKSTSTWYNTSTFTFTNGASFGAGGVQYYRYVWDQSSTHTWTDTETQWSSGTLALNATSNGSWYLHLKSFNGEDTANSTTADLGPYYFDGSGPGITDNQAGDNSWRSSSGTTYDIDFSDTGGSNLNNIQYQVYSGASQTGTLLKDWTNIVTSVNAPSYTTDFSIDFSSLQEGTNYVTLRAYDNAGSSQTLVDAFYVKKDTVSPSSSSVVVNDGTGTDLTWVTSLTTLSSNWSGFSDSNSGLSSYEYSIGTTSGGTNTLGWTSNGSLTNFTNSSLVLMEGSTYYVSIRAKDQANNTSSVKSSNGVRVDTLAPSTVLSVSPSSPDGSNGWYKTLPALSLSSTDSTSGVALTYYQWELTSGVWTNYSSSFPGLEGEHSLYYYSSDNASNNESYKSSSLKVDTSSPGAPSSLAAQSVSTSQINLSWESSSDPTSGIDFYKVYRSLDNLSFEEIASATSTSYSDTGLKASTTYFYKVSSVDKAGNESTSSNTASATTKSPPSKSPSPTNPPSDEEEGTGTSPAPLKAKPEETLKVKEVVIKVGEKNLSLTPNEKNEVKVLEGIVKKVTIKVPIADALSATAVINGKEYTLTKEGDYFVGEVKVPLTPGSYEVVIKYVTSKGEEKQAKSITLLVDPSGFVYDKDTKARIGNAKVGLFKYDAKAKAYSLWEAKSYGQENPQETNKNGKYGFMVPKGKYYLLVEAPLYESYKSKVLEVEAEPLTLNIGLELENQVIPQEKAQSLPPYLILIFVFGLALVIGGATYLFRRPKNIS